MKNQTHDFEPRGFKRRALSATLAATFLAAGVAGTQVAFSGPASAAKPQTTVFDCMDYFGVTICLPVGNL